MGRKAYRVSLRQPGCRNISSIFATRFLFPGQVATGNIQPGKRGRPMAKLQGNRKCSSLLKSFVCLVATFVFLPCTVFAEPLVLTRIIDEIDSINISSLDHAKLGATIKTDKKGDMVVRCFNLFNVPVAKKPFNENPALQKLVERTQLAVDQKGNGVFVKLAVAF
jgi:hypothetical protein